MGNSEEVKQDPSFNPGVQVTGNVRDSKQDSILNTVTDGEPEPPQFLPTEQNDNGK